MKTVYKQSGFVLYKQDGVYAPVSEGDTVHLMNEDYIVVDKVYRPEENRLELILEYIN